MAETPRQEARAAGRIHYQGRPCKRGHPPLRYVTGGCVACIREHCRARRLAKPPSAMVLASRARQEARAAGRRHYQGRPCVHGHDGMRYVSCTSCVRCACSPEPPP